MAGNTSNRAPRKNLIQKYVRIIKRGGWILNGEPIIFTPDGTLLNGQHRLIAISLCDVTVDVFITFGIDKSAYPSLDTGGGRKAGDALYVAGYTTSEAQALGAAVGSELKFRDVLEIGDLKQRGRDAITYRLIVDEVESDPRYMETYDFIRNLNIKPVNLPVPNAKLMFLMYRMFQIDKEFTAEWFTKFITGLNITCDDTNLNFVRTELLAGKRDRVKIPDYIKLGSIIKAWRHDRDGKTYRNLGVLFNMVQTEGQFITLDGE